VDVQNASNQFVAFKNTVKARDASAEANKKPVKADGAKAGAPEAARKEAQKKSDTPPDKQITDELNEFLKQSNRRAQYYVHEGTKRLAVKIIDNETQEVIREIPPEAVLELAAKIEKFSGLFLDTHV